MKSLFLLLLIIANQLLLIWLFLLRNVAIQYIRVVLESRQIMPVIVFEPEELLLGERGEVVSRQALGVAARAAASVVFPIVRGRPLLSLHLCQDVSVPF